MKLTNPLYILNATTSLGATRLLDKPQLREPVIGALLIPAAVAGAFAVNQQEGLG